MTVAVDLERDAAQRVDRRGALAVLALQIDCAWTTTPSSEVPADAVTPISSAGTAPVYSR